MEQIFQALSMIVTPILFALVIFFLKRFITDNDKLRESVATLTTKLIIAEKDLDNRIRIYSNDVLSQMELLKEDLKEALLAIERINELKQEIANLKYRDDLIWDELQCAKRSKPYTND